ncbi:hypothetical protein [Motilibacter aurantiacus]|uniref:hypothetical protein n=1 Tax=Motilibacter aurantiacus TaxID=2714955 RepID=UPI001409B0F6|nr:hypothetical protein [Motilibacter aurantiacus]NHC44549.1 hypothetical protein [Motilibacter aurantiacus]
MEDDKERHKRELAEKRREELKDAFVQYLATRAQVRESVTNAIREPRTQEGVPRVPDEIIAGLNSQLLTFVSAGNVLKLLLPKVTSHLVDHDGNQLSVWCTAKLGLPPLAPVYPEPNYIFSLAWRLLNEPEKNLSSWLDKVNSKILPEDEKARPNEKGGPPRDIT